MSHDYTDELYKLGNDGFRKDKNGHAIALWVRENTALALVHAVALGSKVVDNVIGAIGNDAVAKEKIHEHIAMADQASMLVAWGDRPSSLSWLASPEAILLSIRTQCEDGRTDEDTRDDRVALAAAVIRGLALQLCERADYDEILDQELGDYTLRDLLIAAVAVMVPRSAERDISNDDEDGADDERDHEHTDGRLRDNWILVGLDPDEAEERLRTLDPDILILVTATHLFKAQRELAEKREAAGLPSSNVGSADDA